MEKLNAVADEIASQQSDDSNKKRTRVVVKTVDVRSSSAVYGGVRNALADLARSDSAEPHPNAQVDVLINNAGLALGAPARFPGLKLEDIDAMVATNLSGILYTTHVVLNVSSTSSSDDTSMLARKSGIIVNITSTTALEVPTFPGEAVYHTTKALQEAFTNSLRTELQGTNIQVLVVRPGVVADTGFHVQRMGGD